MLPAQTEPVHLTTKRWYRYWTLEKSLALKPDTRYRFSCVFRTKDLTEVKAWVECIALEEVRGAAWTLAGRSISVMRLQAPDLWRETERGFECVRQVRGRAKAGFAGNF